jgi:hypothetical protein
MGAAGKLRGVRVRRFRHVPRWEKIAAGLVVAVAVVAGVALADAGDASGTSAVRSCPAGSDPVRDAGVALQCSEPSDVDATRVATAAGVASQVASASISVPGGTSSPVAIAPSGVGRISLTAPLFAIGVMHDVELRDAAKSVLDRFGFTVPAASGAMAKIATEHGGTVACDVDHAMPVPPGRSGAHCVYADALPAGGTQPVDAGGEDGQGVTVPAVVRTATIETDAKPWSLLLIPGAAIGALGALALDERRRDGAVRIGQDDGLPPPALPAPNKKAWKTAQAEAAARRSFVLRVVLDQIKDVNPQHGVINCMFTAIATDLTLGGKPASAAKNPLHPAPVDWFLNYARQQYGHAANVFLSIDDVTKVVDIWGDGARGIVVFTRPDGTGHAINVVNVGGCVLYVDGQSGTEFTKWTPPEGGTPYKKYYVVKTN